MMERYDVLSQYPITWAALASVLLIGILPWLVGMLAAAARGAGGGAPTCDEPAPSARRGPTDRCAGTGRGGTLAARGCARVGRRTEPVGRRMPVGRCRAGGRRRARVDRRGLVVGRYESACWPRWRSRSPRPPVRSRRIPRPNPRRTRHRSVSPVNRRRGLSLAPAELYRVEPRRTEQAPRIDGRLDEEAWRSAAVIDAFVQQEPSEGDPATEPTVVRLLYDARALYIGVEAFDSRPAAVIATEMRRDSPRLFDEDNFQNHPRHLPRPALRLHVRHQPPRREARAAGWPRRAREASGAPTARTST